MNQLLWHLRTSSSFELLAAFAIPFLIFVIQYEIDHVFLLVRHLVLVAKHGRGAPPLASGKRPDALLIMPTMLRSQNELEGLKEAVVSAATNRYRGKLSIVVAIDDGFTNRAIYHELERWIASYVAPAGVTIFATCTTERRGKACAIDAAVHLMERKLARGEIAAMPPVFFNMDADSELGPDALVRMVDRLTTKSRVTGVRPRMVTSNVSVSKRHYWFGWRGFFTVRGQIALQVAREYLTAISVGKFNTKLLPVLWASGALYCTWTQLHVVSPRWGAFMQTLTLRDVAKWWVGYAPPSFANSDVAPLPEAQTGPGDDTWMTWMACCARWNGDELVTELPRTPVHAAWYAIYDYVVRPVRHEPEARIMTRTPTTVKALFKQRIRWNTSRIQDVLRWRPAMMFHWSVGFPALLSTAQLVIVNLAVAVALLVWPFVPEGGGFVPFLVAMALNLFLRTSATVLGLIIDRPVPGNALKLFALPLSMPYHFVFNVLPTIVGSVQDIFLFGVNTKFSPEKTHIKSGTTRIAIAFRVRRALAMAIRSIVFNDVPLGWFWFGWSETPWTPSGFEGWTSGKKRRAMLPLARLAFWRHPEQAVTATANAARATTTATVVPPSVEVAPTSQSLEPSSPISRNMRPKVVSIRPASSTNASNQDVGRKNAA